MKLLLIAFTLLLSVGCSAESKNPPNYIEYQGEKLYLSGTNLAWMDFANDFGHGLDEKQLREALQALSRAGANTLRWWIHVDGTVSPSWVLNENSEPRVAGLTDQFLKDFQRALDVAAEYDMYIVPSLWSFDMLKCNDYRSPPNAYNIQLLINDEVLDSYIENVLNPLVTRFNRHKQLIAWELFNEPENMTEPWLPEQSTGFWHWDDEAKKSTYVECAKPFKGPFPNLPQLQRTQARMTAAIHRTAQALGQTALVTTGTKSMGKYSSDVAGGYHWYRDDRMIKAADGDELATLDFYQPHYYNNEGKEGAWSPFHHKASYWGVDKPIVVGEFYLKDLDVLDDPVEATHMCRHLKDNGYAGDWSWQWYDGDKVRQDILNCLKYEKD